MPEITRPPKVFISYAWEDDIKTWVRALAKRLRKDGVETVLDQWETDYGDQLPEFMEKAVRESDFVILICTPKYKKKSDERQGGVGYEGHIITAEIFENNNHRKFIPVLRKGNWIFSAPSWAAGKLYIDLRANPYSEENYRDLLKTLHGKKPTPPPIGTPPDFPEEDMDEAQRPNPFAKFYLRLTESVSVSFDRLKSALPKAVSFLKLTGFAGIVIGLSWAGWRYIPPFVELFPTPKATATLSIHSPVPPTKTRVPNKTATPAPTKTVLILPTTTKIPTATADSNKTSPKDGAQMVFVQGRKEVDSFWIDQKAINVSMFRKFVEDTGYSTDAEKNGVGFVWMYLGAVPSTQYPGQTGVSNGLKLKSGVNWMTPYSDDKYANWDFPYPSHDEEYSDNADVLQVSWNDAKAYCAWAGRDLPLQEEWILAKEVYEEFYRDRYKKGEWGDDKVSRISRIVFGFGDDGFVEYRSADIITFRCKK